MIRLVRRNWINIWAIKGLIKNVADPNNNVNSFTFGQDAQKDLEFIRVIRNNMPIETQRELGLETISNRGLLQELNVLNSRIIAGTPRIEIEKQCPTCPTPQTVEIPVVDGCPQCPQPPPCEPEIITNNVCIEEQISQTCDQNFCKPICESFAAQMIQQYCPRYFI